MSDPTASEGFDIEWYPDTQWRLVTEDEHERKCRGSARSKCPGQVVAVMRRAFSRTVSGMDFFYCADHLYGRKIIDGKILTYRWVASATSADADSKKAPND